MKLKSLRKLALSGVALAAAATTLGTSTFAWYVTNSTATVDGVNGAAKAGGLGNILVAQKSTATAAVNGHGEFEQDITLNSGSFNVVTNTTTGLIPALPVTSFDSDNITTSVTAATKLTSATKWVDVEGKEAGSVAYIQFDIWVLSTDAETVNFSFTINNTTASTGLANQIAYAASGLPTGVSQGNTFNVNIVDALRMGFTQTDYNSALAGTEADSSVILDVAASATSVTNTYNGYTTGGNANSYYKAVLGASSDIVEASTTALSQGTTAITVHKGLETKLSFYIWLEGSDAQCFDSCSGQTFEIDFTFDTTI